MVYVLEVVAVPHLLCRDDISFLSYNTRYQIDDTTVYTHAYLITTPNNWTWAVPLVLNEVAFAMENSAILTVKLQGENQLFLW